MQNGSRFKFKILVFLIINSLTVLNLKTAAAEPDAASFDSSLVDCLVPADVKKLTDDQIMLLAAKRLATESKSDNKGASGDSSSTAKNTKFSEKLNLIKLRTAIGTLTVEDQRYLAAKRAEAELKAIDIRTTQAQEDWAHTKKCVRYVATAACITAIAVAGVYYSVPRTVKLDFGEFKMNVGLNQALGLK